MKEIVFRKSVVPLLPYSPLRRIMWRACEINGHICICPCSFAQTRTLSSTFFAGRSALRLLRRYCEPLAFHWSQCLSGQATITSIQERKVRVAIVYWADEFRRLHEDFHPLPPPPYSLLPCVFATAVSLSQKSPWVIIIALPIQGQALFDQSMFDFRGQL